MKFRKRDIVFAVVIVAFIGFKAYEINEAVGSGALGASVDKVKSQAAEVARVASKEERLKDVQKYFGSDRALDEEIIKSKSLKERQEIAAKAHAVYLAMTVRGLPNACKEWNIDPTENMKEWHIPYANHLNVLKKLLPEDVRLQFLEDIDELKDQQAIKFIEYSAQSVGISRKASCARFWTQGGTSIAEFNVRFPEAAVVLEEYIEQQKASALSTSTATPAAPAQ